MKNKKFFYSIVIIAITILMVQRSYSQQWLTAGNNLSANGIIGGTDADPYSLLFYSAGSERMRLTNTGTFGIGLTPQFMVDVLNSSQLRTLNLNSTYSGTSTKYGIYNLVSSAGSGIHYGQYNNVSSQSSNTKAAYGDYTKVTNSGSGKAYGFYADIITGGSGTHYGIYSSAAGSTNYAFYGLGRGYFSSDLQIDGKLTATAASPFIVESSIGSELEISAGDGQPSELRFLRVDHNSFGWKVNSDGIFILNWSPDNFSSNITEILRIGSGGQVAIGSDDLTGTDKLRVCGTIKCKELKIESGWCDYVFEKNYELMPLQQVSDFIKLNKHLPNIPAACEVEQGGLQLGDMSIKMMEKIEELTLYLISQDEKIQQLEEKLNTIESNQSAKN